MQFSELREACEEIVQDTANTLWSDADWNRFINHALKAVTKNAPWEMLGTCQGYTSSTTATTYIDAPSDFLHLVKATLATYGCTFLPMELRDLIAKNDFYTGTTTSPKVWLSNNDIYFSPTVSGTTAYEIWYVKVPSTLSSDSDDSPLNDTLDKAIIYNAVSQAWAKGNDKSESKHYYEMYMSQMKEVAGEQGTVQG